MSSAAPGSSSRSREPAPLPPEAAEVPRRALVVAPHPDDAEYDAAGTIATWTRAGAQVTLVLCTDGSKGSASRRMTPGRVAALRMQAQRQAAAILGIREVVCLGHPDAELEETPAFRGELVREVRRARPDVVLAPDPLRRAFYYHRDHRITGQVALDAVFPCAGSPLYYPEHLGDGLRPHKARLVYLWDSESPDTYIDISGAIAIKAAALRQHTTEAKRLERDGGVETYLRELARETGKPKGMPCAEAFRVLPVPWHVPW